ncbi:aldehyde-activating protein [Devosia sp. 17-2-E-8]|nr:aldehyde-activating protein [Devosia sp. 17-2-E-8]
MSQNELTGGCQCGAVRFRVESLGRPSICHCRMCQKAFGSFFGPLVTGLGVVWTRGQPKLFRSSNLANRGFCADCGTPLTYQADGHEIELAIGALDHPELAAPAIQVNPADRLPYFEGLANLPMQQRSAEREPFYAAVVSYQHPDHDTTRSGDSA